MKIAISGGMGFEDALCKSLKGFPIMLVGSKYDLVNERFYAMNDVEFYPEFLTHNYSELFSQADVIIDVSVSNKAKYIASEVAAYFKKKSYVLIYNNGWKIYCLSNSLNQILPYQKAKPFLTLPSIDVNEVVDFFLKEKDNFYNNEAFVYDLQSKEKSFILESKDDNFSYPFINGEISDIVSVSCSDNSVGISQLNDVSVDIEEFRTVISQFVKIQKKTPFFFEFKVGKYNVLFFRQFRVVVKGTKEKNTALWIFYNYVGN